LAVGTVVAVRETGTTVNDNPRVQITFRVVPLDGGPAFEAHKLKTVSHVEVPQPGQRYPVWFDPSDPTEFAYAMVDDAYGRALIVALFGEAFGPDGSGAGRVEAPPPPPESDASEALLLQLDLLHAADVVDEVEYAAQRTRITAGR